MVKKICVVGAGSSGLAAIKCCLEEDLEPTCFERYHDIGGLWRYKEDPEEGRASIYKSVIINTSKEMMCFSDYPIPDDFPNYMHNSKIMDYFRMYAKNFNLLKYIRFKTTVCSIKKRPDFAISGQWEIVTECDGKQDMGIYDGVLLCSGHHTFPNLPLESFPGIEKFKGQYFHSREYKYPHSFQDKRIIVIGIGNSGGDLAVELSTVAQQVYLSTRRGAWVINRVHDEGYPLDVVLLSRFKNVIKEFMTTDMLNCWVEKRLNARFNHENFGLKPKHRILSQHPTINDDLPNRIISGKVIMKTNVKGFTETDAIFEDGTIEKNIDVVFFATGYSFSFPFFEDSVLNAENNKIPLYKFVFPPHLEKTTVACIGLIQPLGAIMPVSELQCRWAVRVFKGLAKLPSQEDMLADVACKKKEMECRYVTSPRHTIQVDYLDYMDELASQFGVKPNLLHFLFTDPILAWEMFFGPCTPYQYRLMGSNKWSGARKAILTQQERIIKPTKSRVLVDDDMKKHHSVIPFPLKLLAVFALLAAVYFICL
ncbi:flavin containing dimethylaniline monoxygenase 5 gene 2 S homeolog [Xenopus laevis]|uniref:Flavin-containing monooxygenase n=1 Tax=Xenopus laevis TaxID=8355 RepID=Q6PB07_XENLA|nr:flavin containing dimethylaniline monoxygenase 5 gene 2 S homeolog [Xenopus laevis]AAH59977.1 MGC68633 protein [Xenopus laevis]